MSLMVLIGAGSALYGIVVLALLKTFQSIRKRDEVMRVITAEWLRESAGPAGQPQ